MTKKQRSQFLLENLESRLLFSSDVALLPVDGGTPISEVDSSLEVELRPLEETNQQSSNYAQKRLEVVFVDAGVDEAQELIDNLKSTFGDAKRFETVLLESEQDGIEQISDYLSGQQDISAVHILSHGSDGEITLGNTQLNNQTLNQYAEALEGWQQSLTAQADLLIYGCNLAQGPAGLQLIDNLRVLTGADIAASDDATGHASRGGDWELEQSQGAVEAEVALSAEIQQSWHGLLAANLTLHPTGDGATSGFTVNGGSSAWDVVNDQAGNAGTGAAEGNNGADNITDGSGARQMFSLDNGTVPAGSTITDIQIVAQANKPGGGAKPTIQLSYQRIGTDPSPVDGAVSPQFSNATYTTFSESLHRGRRC